MADEATVEPQLADASPEQVTSEEDMELETTTTQEPDPNDNNGKREREEEQNDDGVEPNKKPKVEEEEEKSAEEVRLGRVSLGPKSFGSSVEMFDYFFKFLHYWPINLNVNEYEHKVLMDLLKKGHEDSTKKIGIGIQAFQVRFHPMWKSKCFFLIREDESVDDFSFRKCVDHILPLPEDMKVKSDANKALGGKGRGGKWSGGGRGGGGRFRGRGVK